MYREEYEIMDKVRRIVKGECPNFYLTGSSITALENIGMQIANTIVEEKLMSFKGAVPYFTIKLPYFEETSGAFNFIKHLENSYSIAKDCYDSFSGILMVELAEKWSSKGYNSKFDIVLEYLQKAEYQQVRFIFLVPGRDEKIKGNSFYAELLRCGIWMKIQIQTTSIEQCVELFEKLAKEKGLCVSGEAGKILTNKLKERKEAGMENRGIVEKLLKQILFERSEENNFPHGISEGEILGVLGSRKENEKRTIGFVNGDR